MEIEGFIKEYRKACSLTQRMFADEIMENTNKQVHVNGPVINGIENRKKKNGSENTNSAVLNYLYKEFFYIDHKRSNQIATLSYRIAEDCVEHKKEIDITRLFSCITKKDLHDYLYELLLNEDEQDENSEEVLFDYLNKLLLKDEQDEDSENKGDKHINCLYLIWFLADTTESNPDPEHNIRNRAMNDTAIFIFNTYFWYFILSTKKECDLTKEVKDIDELTEFAIFFGFKEFKDTSSTAKGKITNTLNKRYALFKELNALICSNKDYQDCNQENNDHIVKVARILEDEDNEYYQKNEKLFKSSLNMLSSLKENEEIDLMEDMKEIRGMLLEIRLHLLLIFDFFQGKHNLLSKRYVQIIRNKFDKWNLYRLNPGLENYVKELVDNYNSALDNFDNCPNKQSLYEAYEIRNSLNDLFRYHYVINQKILDLRENDLLSNARM